MNVEEAAAKYRPVSLKALKRMVDEGLLSEPLDEADQHALSVLSRFWSDEWYVAQMNMSFKPDKRALMLAFPNFGKIERYILSSYLPGKYKKKVESIGQEVSKQLARLFSHRLSGFQDQACPPDCLQHADGVRGEKSERLYLGLSALERKSIN